MNIPRIASCAALLLAASIPLTVRAQANDDLAALVAARSHFFGIDNVDQRTGAVDKEKVIISWFSVSSYAMAARGHVVLLDSYIYRVADVPGYVPTTVQELVDLKPEAIFIGHGHGDHADNAAYIAGKTGAHIFGAAEHCDAMAGDAERIFGTGASVNCTSLVSAGSAPGAEVRNLGFLLPDVCITSFKHLHSGRGSGQPDPDYPPNPINPVRDQDRANELYPNMGPPTLNTRTVSGAGGSVSMFYQFTVGNFSLIWHDTNGPIKDVETQLIPLLASLPKADVEIGSLVSTGESVNGVRDIAFYIQLIKPKIFYGGHSDNFNIGASPYYHQALLRQFDIFNIAAAERPMIKGYDDPYDYLTPELATFAWKDKRWREVPTGKQSLHCP